MRLRATPWPPRSHAGVRRPAPPLGHDPVDVLRGALDVARLAVDAVLRVDLQPPLSLLLQVLVHTRGAEALLRPVEDGEVARDRHRVILERQVGRLVALVVRAGERYRREEVEGHLAVRLWVLDGRELGGRLEPLVVGAAVRESEPLPASRDVVHDARVQKGAPHAQRRRVRGGTHVAHLRLVCPGVWYCLRWCLVHATLVVSAYAVFATLCCLNLSSSVSCTLRTCREAAVRSRAISGAISCDLGCDLVRSRGAISCDLRL
mmetsp:Transcript_1974/g.5530  ORF Transcript_1974/g.5530 Transcript_1974/m.5530 type:complete len:262 (-) Transcript_1974:7-792(-)